MKKLLKILPIVLIVIILSVFARAQYEDYLYKKNFKPNRFNQPYSRGVPLDEMDLSRYRTYLGKVAAPQVEVDPSIKTINLPCDVEYYRSKSDKQPVLTLKKGTTVYVYDDRGDAPIGYGMSCWPDYDSKWRYGYPFSTSELTDYSCESMYFVKSKQLKSVAKAHYKFNKDKYLNRGVRMTSSLYVKNVTRKIDLGLYFAGAFCAPHR